MPRDVAKEWIGRRPESMPGKLVDLRGRTMGHWTVLELAAHGKGRRSRWLCRCVCGTERVVASVHLVNGASVSCGCQRPRGPASRKYKHGMPPEYGIWLNIKQRCGNPNNPAYQDYGGRGIVMCQEWSDNFCAFMAAVGSRPSKAHSIDRIDNDRGYEPGNCRWATRTEQARNQRSNHLVTYAGRTMTLTEACELAGANYGTVKWRLGRGVPESEAFR